MTGPTPGPWTFKELSGNDSRGQGYIHGPDGREISHHGVMERWREENLANARLIASAPDLLEVAQRTLAMVSEGAGPPDWDWIREVISKATPSTGDET